MSKGSGGTRGNNSSSAHNTNVVTSNSSVYKQAEVLDNIAIKAGFKNSIKWIDENKPQIEIDAVPGSFSSEYIKVSINADGTFHIGERGNRPNKADSFEDYSAKQVEKHIKEFKKYYDWFYLR